MGQDCLPWSTFGVRFELVSFFAIIFKRGSSISIIILLPIAQHLSTARGRREGRGGWGRGGEGRGREEGEGEGEGEGGGEGGKEGREEGRGGRPRLRDASPGLQPWALFLLISSLARTLLFFDRGSKLWFWCIRAESGFQTL